MKYCTISVVMQTGVNAENTVIVFMRRTLSFVDIKNMFLDAVLPCLQSELYYCSKYLHAKRWKLWLLFQYREMLYWIRSRKDRRLKGDLKTYRANTEMLFKAVEYKIRLLLYFDVNVIIKRFVIEGVIIVICFIGVGMPVLSFLLGRKLQKVLPESTCISKLKLKSEGLRALFVIVFCFMCLYRTPNKWIWLFCLNLPFVWSGFSKEQPILSEGKQLKLQKSHLLWGLTLIFDLVLFWLCLRPVYNMDWRDSAVFTSNRISMIYVFVLVWVIAYLILSFFNTSNKVNGIILFTTCFTWILVLSMKFLWRSTYTYTVKIEIESLFADQVILLNVGVLLLIGFFFFECLGKGWGIVLNVILYIFLFLSNYIKLRYHGTFFTWIDLLQLKEFILIGREFLTFPIIVGIIIGIVVIGYLIVKFRKKIGIFLKIRICIFPTLVLIVLLGNIYFRISNDQYSYLDIYKRTWENESVNVRLNGLVINLVYNFNALQDIVMDKPKEYSEEKANDLLKEFQNLDTNSSVMKENPDVILIMGESLFDIEEVNGLEFDKDVDATIDEYSTSAMLSPRFGGYTSAMEFEALTGLTLAFMPPSLTPFTTYFNNPEEEFPSIVQEFKKNGYSSVAIHPDLADFYNRTVVYENMGFDEYQSITSFEATEENTTLNGWITDDALGDRIIDELEKTDLPKFIYAVTMEEHYVNVDKYSEPEVHVTSDLLSEDVLATISQQATSYYHTDLMIKKIVEYMNNTDRPTLLYLFGDHLPPLESLGELGYTNDLENKYRTTLLMYANYKELTTGTEYITPNQIAAQIVTDAGIEHNTYFDYLYHLRKDYPVVHQEFTEIENNSDLDLYRFIQYDLLFGDRYLVK